MTIAESFTCAKETISAESVDIDLSDDDLQSYTADIDV